MKRLLLTALLFFPLLSVAQMRPERIVVGWDFFVNDRSQNAEHEAYIYTVMNYKYQPYKVEGDRIFINFTVSVALDTAKSYFDQRKRYNDVKLLKHEQGHADINFIYGKQLYDQLNATIFYKTDYQKKIKELFDKIYGASREAQEKYDKETNHSKNTAAQEAWDKYLAENL